MVFLFAAMWYGAFVEIKETQQVIELATGSKTIHQHPYREGPTQREHERCQIEMIIKARGLEPSKRECASPIVLAP